MLWWSTEAALGHIVLARTERVSRHLTAPSILQSNAAAQRHHQGPFPAPNPGAP